MQDVILRNSRAEQYLCAARKNFILRSAPDCTSETSSKILIGHISDLHSDVNRFENAMTIFEYLKPEFAVHTGDMVKWNMEDDYKFFFERIEKSPVPVYNCVGNHDTFNNNGQLDRKYINDELVAPLRNTVNENGNGYYYVDFENIKIRLVVLNDYQASEKCAIPQEQCDWLIQTLKDAANNGFSVIIASHEAPEAVESDGNNPFCQRYVSMPWGYALPKPLVIADIVDAFRNGKSLKKSYCWWYRGVDDVNIDCTFEKKGDFICYISGHSHGDYVRYLSAYPDQLSITMTCSGCKPEDYHNIGDECSDLPRIPGTISEDAVNLYVLDKKNKKITIVRYGACVNDLFEERLVAEYEYDRLAD